MNTHDFEIIGFKNHHMHLIEKCRDSCILQILLIYFVFNIYENSLCMVNCVHSKKKLNSKLDLFQKYHK